MNAVARFLLVVIVTAFSAAFAQAEEPRVNGGWTRPWKLMSVECALYIDTVAQRITNERQFVPFQAIGLFTVACAILMTSMYVGARLQDRDIRSFRRIRAAIRAAARHRGTEIVWTEMDPVRTRCFFWLCSVVTVLFYLLWLLEAAEARDAQPDTVRIMQSPRLIADWWWIAFWFSLFSSFGQGIRWFLVSNDERLTRDLSDEKEAQLLTEFTR